MPDKKVDPRYFTVEEANQLLPEISRLLGLLLERRAKIVRSIDQVDDVVGFRLSDVGSASASQLLPEFEIIEQLIDEINEYGCELKDANVGLIDFLAKRLGREVYLCWRYGEPCEIAYYHELHTGFNGRHPVNSADFTAH